MRLSLLGEFAVTDGDTRIHFATGTGRLLAALALANRALPRMRIAATLWPDATDAHAQGSLRSVLNRLDEQQRRALEISDTELALAPGTTIDLHDARRLARHILQTNEALSDDDTSPDAVALLSQDLVPDWDDEWIKAEQHQWHERRTRALEVLALRLATARRLNEAVEVAYAAIAADPLRENGYAALIRAQLAADDRIAALATFTMYSNVLMTELHTKPSAELESLLRITELTLRPGPSVVVRAQTAVAGEDVEAFEVVATGISMEPTIRHGDTLLVSRHIAPTIGRIVVAIHQGLWIVKRLADRDGAMVLRSDNVNEEVPLTDVDIRGVVVEIHRTV